MKRMARKQEGSIGRSISAQERCGGGHMWDFLPGPRCRPNFIFYYLFPHKNFVLVIQLKIKMLLYTYALKPHGEVEV
jgi:hypothetical protein